MADLLVEVLTVVSPFLQFVAQNADIPVPGARGVPWLGRSSRFFPHQSFFPSDGQIIGIPVPESGQGFHAGHRCSALTSSSLTFLFLVEVLMVTS